MPIPPFPPWLDDLFRILSGGAAVAAISLAWKVISRLNREESLHRDFPPHRHINGSIIYPREYVPTAVEKLPGM